MSKIEKYEKLPEKIKWKKIFCYYLSIIRYKVQENYLYSFKFCGDRSAHVLELEISSDFIEYLLEILNNYEWLYEKLK